MESKGRPKDGPFFWEPTNTRVNRILAFFVVLAAPVVARAQFCPALGPDIELPCGESQVTLTANLSECGAGGAPLLTTTYTVANIPFAPNPTNGTAVTMSDDQVQGPFPIGFSFCFFGNTYTQFYIGSNGWVGFSAGQSTSFTSAPIPSTAGTVPKNCIMGPWQDWHPGIAGGPYIRYQTTGTAPCRKLVVSYTNLPFFSCTTTQGTFQIVLNEGSNVIENHITNKPSCTQWAGGTAVQGIHNLAGTVAFTVPNRNSTVWTTTNNSWAWTPNGAPAPVTYTWFEVGNPTPVATGSQTVTLDVPSGGAAYTCQVGYTGCYGLCGGEALNADTVFVTPGSGGITLTVNALDPLCNGACDGSAEVTIEGGVPEYTILWLPGGFSSPSVDGLCAGSYTVSVTDTEDCTESQTVIINNPPPLTIGGSIEHN